jgi:Organic Anion Transporter Polypeptide (OATP) family
MTLCGNNHTDFEDCANASSGNISAFIFLAAHMVLGIGSAVYYCLGMSYLDDNAKKNKAPVLLGQLKIIILNKNHAIFYSQHFVNAYVWLDPRWVTCWPRTRLKFT